MKQNCFKFLCCSLTAAGDSKIIIVPDNSRSVHCDGITFGTYHSKGGALNW